MSTRFLGLSLAGLLVAGCASGAKVDVSDLILGARIQGRLQAEFTPLCATPPKIPASACAALSQADTAFNMLLLSTAKNSNLDIDKLLGVLLSGGLGAVK